MKQRQYHVRGATNKNHHGTFQQNAGTRVWRRPAHRLLTTSNGNPFTGEEIRKIVNKIKNEKSAGPADLEVELIKYASTEIHNEIVNIFNILASTGEELQELILGILRPLQEPGKEKDPTINLRPIILLSIIRKILTTCMLDRIWNRLKSHIPYKQSANQQGRSNTENVHAIKLLIEKAIHENDYHLYLLLLAMSKAFDTVNRRILFEHLGNIKQK